MEFHLYLGPRREVVGLYNKLGNITILHYWMVINLVKCNQSKEKKLLSNEAVVYLAAAQEDGDEQALPWCQVHHEETCMSSPWP